MNSYRAWLYNKTAQTGRNVIIITDTFQSACNIARTKCAYNESVDSVNTDATDVVVDYAAAGIQDQNIPHTGAQPVCPHPRAG